jgi:hypothetical protein
LPLHSDSLIPVSTSPESADWRVRLASAPVEGGATRKMTKRIRQGLGGHTRGSISRRRNGEFGEFRLQGRGQRFECTEGCQIRCPDRQGQGAL